MGKKKRGPGPKPDGESFTMKVKFEHIGPPLKEAPDWAYNRAVAIQGLQRSYDAICEAMAPIALSRHDRQMKAVRESLKSMIIEASRDLVNAIAFAGDKHD